MTAPTLDIAFVRGQFPAFAEPDLADWAHFENAGGSYAARQTVEALSAFYTRTKVQPYGAGGPTAAAGAAMDRARARWAEALGVATDEVIFGPSTSQNTYVLAHAFRPLLAEGDEIVVTNQDHEANSGVWRRMAKALGLTLREWQVDPETGRLDPADFPGLLSERTRLAVFPHCSNLAGEENPVADLTRQAREAGAWTIVDGVSWAPHEICDVSALGPDIYLFSLYKVYGVHQGVMTVRSNLLEKLENQAHHFNASHPSKRLNPAGPDHAQVAASQGTLDYIETLAAHHGIEANSLRERVAGVSSLWRARERAVAEPVLNLLRDHPRARLIGPQTCDERRAPTIAFLPERLAPPAFEAALAERGIMAGASDFYARNLVEALGIDPATGVVRVSMAHYTSDAEIAALCTALDELL